MDAHAHRRFSETPPGSPKSCMKGSRRLNFEDESSSSSSQFQAPSTSTSHHHHHKHSSSTSTHGSISHHHKSSHQSEQTPQSPTAKRSGKTVMIKSPGSGVTTTTIGTSTKSQCTSTGPTEIPFQFHLSQHYDNPPPPPNCTSNAEYEEERLKKLHEQSPSPTDSDPSSSSNSVAFQLQKSDTYKTHPEKLQQYDPQLVAIASKFVNEILEKAKLEVASKQQIPSKETKRGSTTSSSAGERRNLDFFGLGRTPWYRRAHGVISKWVTNICVRVNAMKN